METLYQRFQETHWRHVYKSLLVLEYCLKNGSERVVDDVRVNIYKLRSLLSFQYIDEKKKDQGISGIARLRKKFI
jgi:epsin